MEPVKGLLLHSSFNSSKFTRLLSKLSSDDYICLLLITCKVKRFKNEIGFRRPQGMHENFAVCKVIQDTVFTLWISDSLSIGIGIPDSNCWRDSWFIELNWGFQSPGFQIPQLPGIQITLHEEKKLSEKVLDWLSDSLTDWLAFIVFV